jgi:hypothetical protein
MFSCIVNRHSNTESTFAVVKADFDNGDSIAAFKSCLDDAIEGWMDETEEGRVARESSVQDFNVGDLVHYNLRCMNGLGGFLAKEGIRNLTIDVTSKDTAQDDSWNFDDVLGCNC